jgi:TusA-related sulfurtransferase
MSESKLVDARNSFCPGPLMELIAHMKRASVGDTLELLSTDQGSVEDVPAWIHKVGHEMVSTEKVGGVWHIKVRKVK